MPFTQLQNTSGGDMKPPPKNSAQRDRYPGRGITALPAPVGRSGFGLREQLILRCAVGGDVA